MLKLSLICPNFSQGPKEFNIHFLPYSTGVLWSFCCTSDLVKQNVELHKLVWRREDIEPLAQELKDNAVVGFSCYIWNWNYNKEIAKETQRIKSGTFGGIRWTPSSY